MSSIYYLYNTNTKILQGSIIVTSSNQTLPQNGTYTKPLFNNNQQMSNVFNISSNVWTLLNTQIVTANSPVSGNLNIVDISVNGQQEVTTGLTFATAPINTPITVQMQLQDGQGIVRSDITEQYTLYYYEREVGNLFQIPIMFTDGIGNFTFTFGTVGIYDLVNVNLAFISAINNKFGININTRDFVAQIYNTYNTVATNLTAIQIATILTTYITQNFPQISLPPISQIANGLNNYIGLMNIKPLSVYAN